MRRELEPEVMDDEAESLEYEAMDNSAPNEAFVARLVELGIRGEALDLGCGPGHIPLLACQRIPDLRVKGVDLAESMLVLARRRLAGHPDLAGRIRFEHADAKGLAEPDDAFDAVFSNTVLHHVPEPLPFLREVARVLRPGGGLLIRDLFRPETPERALELVALHAAGASPGQQELLRASLHAALTPGELRELADAAGLEDAEIVLDSDRHMSLQRAPATGR
ncbi:MAG: class I SAM-dependent methyltransferase [Myxococcota bacterium]